MIWEGNLAQGNGQVTPGSRVVEMLPMTWASRVEPTDGKTSPEELVVVLRWMRRFLDAGMTSLSPFKAVNHFVQDAEALL